MTEPSEWIGYHLEAATDGRVRDPADKRAWIRRSLDFVHLLEPRADRLTVGFLPRAFRDLAGDLGAIDELPASADRVTKVVIADITGRNPNVFYELGISHAYGRRVVLLTQRADDELKYQEQGIDLDPEVHMGSSLYQRLEGKSAGSFPHLACSLDATAPRALSVETILNRCRTLSIRKPPTRASGP